MVIDRMAVLREWRECKILAGREVDFTQSAQQIINFKPLYDEVEKATGVPWYVVGVIDCREESFNHHCYLGNGDSLYRPTRHVPRGRGPFATWQDGAIDALKLDGMDRLPVASHWDIVTALIKLECFNGLGYAGKGLPSPYVWAGTSIQRPGKYVADGHFDPHALDQQPGCAGIFLALKSNYSVDLKEG